MARHTSPLRPTARCALFVLAAAAAALAVGAPAASAKDDGAPLSGLTGPLAQTGPIGAVPTLEQLGGLLGGGSEA
ncbi:hypothetical protein AQJ66_12870 [Streptomyces bungoensis]|uniref:ATP-binding protein n=1 Tax=Streptomyces bungoensis TaxID=285568 RepID=A0A101T5C2_9ACTN|nr:hypothetical protein [Streptomyces bungoensis]KUN85838.1 hypothetical protein AQJ66_12870 [Streptomyces bungoensis]